MTQQQIDVRRLLLELKIALRELDASTELEALKPGLSLAITDWVWTRSFAEELKQAKAILDNLVVAYSDDIVPHQLDRLDLTSAHHELGQVKLSYHTKASIRPGCKPQAYEWLRAHDLGGIIIETINSQTLGATAKSLTEQGKDLPGELFSVGFRRYAAFTAKD